ncbi:MAG: methylmalonyl-CoA mutase family protein [Geminicoccaceae bacterium]|nr:methylmalonyl-CoA mutase family protein [Geminicoccaceae bacterium]
MEAGGFEPLAAPFLPPDVEAWRKAAAKAAGEGGLGRLVRHTLDRIAVDPLYAPPLGNAQPVAAPAGGWPSGWEVAQPHRHPDPATANRQIREDLGNGATAAIVRLDRALARGGEVPDGVLAYDRDAFARLLDGLAPEQVVLEAGARALNVADALAGEAARVAADPIGAVLEGAPVDPEDELARLLAAMPASPRLFLVADGRPWHAAGASEAQELAATLATWLFCLRALEARGFTVEEAADRIELVLAVDDDLFLSLAKLRAARLVAERILEASGVADAAARVRIRAETGERMLARLDPWVNILRTTVAAFAAVAGGAEAVTVVPFDRPLQEPSPLARRIARNVQLILREEAGLGRVRDPAAGSWYVGHLTRSLAETAFEGTRRIEEEGGILAALRSGRPQAEVATTRGERERLLAGRALELTGVSAFPTLEERAPPAPEPVDLEPALTAARAALANAGSRAVESGIAPLPRIRLAEPFERLRERADAAARRRGARPSIPVVGLGRPAELHDLSTWVENLLAVGGIGALRLRAEGDTIATARGAPAAVLCVGASAAERAAEQVAALRGAGVKRIWVAGTAPASIDEADRLAPGLDVLAFHDTLHRLLGIGGEGERG